MQQSHIIPLHYPTREVLHLRSLGGSPLGIIEDFPHYTSQSPALQELCCSYYWWVNGYCGRCDILTFNLYTFACKIACHTGRRRSCAVTVAHSEYLHSKTWETKRPRCWFWKKSFPAKYRFMFSFSPPFLSQKWSESGQRCRSMSGMWCGIVIKCKVAAF